MSSHPYPARGGLKIVSMMEIFRKPPLRGNQIINFICDVLRGKVAATVRYAANTKCALLAGEQGASGAPLAKRGCGRRTLESTKGYAAPREGRFDY